MNGGAVNPFDRTPNGSPLPMRTGMRTDGRAATSVGGLRPRQTFTETPPNLQTHMSDPAFLGVPSVGDRSHRRSDSQAVRRSFSERRLDEDTAADVVIDISPAFNPYLHHFATPAPQDGRTVHCKVLRSRGKKRHVSYRMVTDTGDELLTAVRKEDDFWISMTSSDLLGDGGEAAGGALDIQKSQQRSFSLLRCPPDSTPDDEPRTFLAYNAQWDAQGKALVAQGDAMMVLSHGTVVASMNLPQVNTMRVAFPDPEHQPSGLGHLGQPLVTAEYLIGAIAGMDAARADADDADGADRDSFHRRGGAPRLVSRASNPNVMVRSSSQGNLASVSADGLCLLESRVPVWNQRTESYVLNFHGRATLASSKNLQLVRFDPHKDKAATLGRRDADAFGRAEQTLSKGSKELPTFLYGKVDKDTYNLDYQYPLSAFHAFVIAVSVTDW